jgi:hypothetical protein
MQIEISQYIVGQRNISQDAIGVIERPHSTVIVVADGAGGTENGDIASQSVINEVRFAAHTLQGDIDWVQVLRQVDHAIGSGQSTACIAELSDHHLHGASVGDCRVAIKNGLVFDFPSDGQSRKPLLGTGDALPIAFSRPWSGDLVIAASDGLWNYCQNERIMSASHQIDFPIFAKHLVDMVKLPLSGGYVDDVAVVCARRRKIARQQFRINLLSEYD